MLQKKIPVLLLLMYMEGITTVLKKANINHYFSDTRPRLSDDEIGMKESDLEKQLAALDATEVEIRRKMALIGDVNELSEISDWEENFREYLEDLRVGLESLNAAPQTDEERREQFELKRKFVQSVVDKVTINKERELQVWFRFNLLALGSQAENFRENKSVGTCTRKSACPSRPHLRGCGG